jgi:imidazoleglycerol-phosphate dehydratase
MTERTATVERTTGETDIRVELALDGGDGEISSGIGFFDHMLRAVAKHGRFGLELECNGDLEVDDHHTVEDCSLALGSAFDEALGERAGIERFGHAYAPLDEALARTVIDLSGRPFAVANLEIGRTRIGELSTELIPHVFESFSNTAGAAVHVDVLRGANDHHRSEAAFKSFALALRRAVQETGGADVPSTKGVL